ncbi:MAG: FAD-dependent oxidoreductase [Gemmataceae bacterium]|nr:FAD-dependent oxidoreductase [Gemmataceae bacterium]
MFHRRNFLRQCGAAALLNSLAPSVGWSRSGELAADVITIGAGLGGIAAALGALRGGASVILTEETAWIGGQLTSQLVPPDEHRWIEQFGCTASYRKLRTDIRDLYRKRTNRSLKPELRNKPQLNPGNGWVSRLCCEPAEGVAALKAMLAPYIASKQLILLQPWRPTGAEATGDRVRAVTGTDLKTGQTQTLVGKYFLDATEQGDLLPWTGCEFVTGFESQKDTGEPHAPAIARPDDVQSFTVCCILAYDPKNEKIVERPADYEFWRDYQPQLRPPYIGPLFSWNHPSAKDKRFGFHPTEDRTPEGPNLWTYRRIIDSRQFEPGSYPGPLSCINWHQNDNYLGGLHAGVTPAETARNLARARSQSLSLVHWLQTEAPRTDGGKGWPQLRLDPHAAGSGDGLALAPYIRESRRIRAEFTVVEQHVVLELRMKETKLSKDEVKAADFRDTVGIGHYPLDLHPSTGGINGMGYTVLPFQIPLGALLPVRLENLLPACKNLGVTHLSNGCYRLHPVEWNIGEASGALAAYCLAKQLKPKQVRADSARLGEYQKILRDHGVELEWPASARLP